MTFALYLELAGAVGDPVHDVIQLMASASPDSQPVTAAGIGLHLTLAMFDRLPDQAAADLLDIVSTRVPPPLRFSSWGVFPGVDMTVFLAPVHSAELRRLHEACNAAIGRFAAIAAHYRREEWVPHATLMEHVPTDDLADIVRHLADLPMPLALEARAVAISEFPPLRLVASRPLG